MFPFQKLQELKAFKTDPHLEGKGLRKNKLAKKSLAITKQKTQNSKSNKQKKGRKLVPSRGDHGDNLKKLNQKKKLVLKKKIEKKVIGQKVNEKVSLPPIQLDETTILTENNEVEISKNSNKIDYYKHLETLYVGINNPKLENALKKGNQGLKKVETKVDSKQKFSRITNDKTIRKPLKPVVQKPKKKPPVKKHKFTIEEFNASHQIANNNYSLLMPQFEPISFSELDTKLSKKPVNKILKPTAKEININCKPTQTNKKRPPPKKSNLSPVKKNNTNLNLNLPGADTSIISARKLEQAANRQTKPYKLPEDIRIKTKKPTPVTILSPRGQVNNNLISSSNQIRSQKKKSPWSDQQTIKPYANLRDKFNHPNESLPLFVS